MLQPNRDAELTHYRSGVGGPAPHGLGPGGTRDVGAGDEPNPSPVLPEGAVYNYDMMSGF